MHLARDPYTQETVVLDNAWPWAFLAPLNPSTSISDQIILSRLTDHCAACGAMRNGISYWRGTALPFNPFLDASTNVPDEPTDYLDLVPLIWHGENLAYYLVDQDTQDYWNTVVQEGFQRDFGTFGSRSFSEPPPDLKAPFTPRPSPSALMRLPVELCFMIMEELSQPTTSDAYGCSLGTTRSKDGVLSTENLTWALHWARLRAVCRQLKLEADAHICRWTRSHDISVHAWDLTGSLDMPLALFAQVTRLTVFFDVMDILKSDIELEPAKVNFALLQDYYKALHFIAMMPQLSSLKIRWRADTKDAITDDMIDDLQNIVYPEVFQALYSCSPTAMECLESITFVGFDSDIQDIDEEWYNRIRAEEQLGTLDISFIGTAKAEYVA